MNFSMDGKEDTVDTGHVHGKERRSVVVLGFIFLCVFASFISIQNLQSSINEEGGLGVTSLLCVYVASTISCIYAPLAIEVFSAKWVIAICCSVHALYAISNFYPKFYTLIPTSILLGLITGPFWTTQGIYITTIALAYAERTKKSSSYVLGRLFSTFSLIYYWSQIVGNFLSSVLLGIGSDTKVKEEEENATYITNISSVINNISVACCHRCAVNHCPDTGPSRPQGPGLSDKAPLYYLLGVFVLFILAGLCISVFLLPPLPRTVESHGGRKKSVITGLVSCGHLLKDPIMLLLIPSCLAFSWAEGFRWSDITRAYISCSYGVAFVGYLMAAHGFCLGSSAFATSRLVKLVGRDKLLIALYIAFILLVVCYYLLPETRPLYVTVLVVCVHGIIEGPISAQIQATIGLLLGRSKEAAFANFHAWKCISSSAFFAISNLVCVKVRIFILLSLYACAIPSLIVAEILFKRRQHATEVELEVTQALDDDRNIEEGNS